MTKIFLNKTLLLNLLITIAVWLIWFLYTKPDSLIIVQKNWPITLTMTIGSFIAGATSEGGGAIAFPIFTKVLHIPPYEAKVFSLAIQSIGMMAATVTIVLMRISIEWRFIRWASLGGLIGVTIGTILLAPLFSPVLLKMLFTAMIVSFGIALILHNRQQRDYNSRLSQFRWQEKSIILLAGIVGGIQTGLVGTGIDIICFSVMVLLFRLTEKIATPTSVVLMAINAVIGFALHLIFVGGFTETVQSYWLAAIPVVVVGAPLGALLCTYLNNKMIINILISLIFVELVSSLYLIPLTTEIITISTVVFIIFSTLYYVMSKSMGYKTTQLIKDKTN